MGLNEETLLKTAPPAELVEYASRTWDIQAQIPTSDGWVELLEGSGLKDIVMRTYQVNALRESSQINRYALRDLFRMAYRTLSGYIRSPAFRDYMKARGPIPKNLFQYLGYGIYVGRKPR